MRPLTFRPARILLAAALCAADGAHAQCAVRVEPPPDLAEAAVPLDERVRLPAPADSAAVWRDLTWLRACR
jgi:hypothetical protein